MGEFSRGRKSEELHGKACSACVLLGVEQQTFAQKYTAVAILIAAAFFMLWRTEKIRETQKGE
jgi:hypothetical protein